VYWKHGLVTCRAVASQGGEAPPPNNSPPPEIRPLAFKIVIKKGKVLKIKS